MEEIKDLDIYLKRMSVTLLDKCWWIDKIPDEIDTVVDFGCANGELQKMIFLLSGNKYKYIGIDNSAEMRASFCANGEVYASLEQALPHFNPNTSILVLNSVIHEIHSYMSESDRNKLFESFISIGCKYIAIRDMYYFTSAYYGTFYDKIQAVKNSKYANQWNEFEPLFKSRIQLNDYLEYYTALPEFLLKYFYTENWSRECKEQYLHPWKTDFLCYDSYQVDFENDFYIPYIRNHIYKDFGFWWNKPTHKKLLLVKGE